MTNPEATDVLMHRPYLDDLPRLAPLAEGYVVRPLGDADAPELARLLRLAYGEPWDEARAYTELLRAADVNAVYGVVCRGTLVATASSQHQPERAPHSGYVHWVGTHPEQRQRGLASALLYRVLRDFSERGYRSAWLVTQPERLPAIKTYLKFGFVPIYDADGTDHKQVWSRVLQRLAAGNGRPAKGS